MSDGISDAARQTQEALEYVRRKAEKEMSGCPEGKTTWTRSCPCTHPDLIPCRQSYRRPNEAPLCWGTYKDNQKCCKNCRVLQGCAEELALSILEGRRGEIIEVRDL